MKSFLNIVLVLLILSSTIQSAQAEMDPRMKALGKVALYGTVGGALLGVATLAFYNTEVSGRNVAVGASVGLYLGLIFGGYIIYAHYRRRNPYSEPAQYPSDGSSPYTEEGGQSPQFWNPASIKSQDLKLHLQTHRENNPFGKQKIDDVPIYFDLLKYSF